MIVAVLYVLKSIPLRSRIRSSRAPNSRASRPRGVLPPAASSSRMTPPRESRSAVASTSDGEIDRGIDGKRAVAGFSMTTAPPAFLTCHAPAEPSVPVPVRITAMSPAPNAAAAVSRRRSIDGAMWPGRAGRRRSSPSSISTRRFEGTTKITPASRAADSSTTLTGSEVWRARIVAEVAGPPRVEVLGDDDRCREVGGQAGHHAREGFDPARGRADDDELCLRRGVPPHRGAVYDVWQVESGLTRSFARDLAGRVSILVASDIRA